MEGGGLRIPALQDLGREATFGEGPACCVGRAAHYGSRLFDDSRRVVSASGVGSGPDDSLDTPAALRVAEGMVDRWRALHL